MRLVAEQLLQSMFGPSQNAPGPFTVSSTAPPAIQRAELMMRMQHPNQLNPDEHFQAPNSTYPALGWYPATGTINLNPNAPDAVDESRRVMAAENNVFGNSPYISPNDIAAASSVTHRDILLPAPKATKPKSPQ